MEAPQLSEKAYGMDRITTEIQQKYPFVDRIWFNIKHGTFALRTHESTESFESFFDLLAKVEKIAQGYKGLFQPTVFNEKQGFISWAKLCLSRYEVQPPDDEQIYAYKLHGFSSNEMVICWLNYLDMIQKLKPGMWVRDESDTIIGRIKSIESDYMEIESTEENVEKYGVDMRFCLHRFEQIASGLYLK